MARSCQRARVLIAWCLAGVSLVAFAAIDVRRHGRLHSVAVAKAILGLLALAVAALSRIGR